MTLSLYQRLSFALFAVFITITLVFILWWQHVETQTRQETAQRLHLSLAANLARDNPLLQQGIYDHSALENLFHTLMVLGPAFEFYFVDPKGKILTFSADSSAVKRQAISLTPIRALIENNAPLPIFGDDPKNSQRQKIFSAAPVFNGIDLQGYLYVIVAGERYQNTFDDVQMHNRMQVSVLFIIVCLLFLFIVMLWLFSFITKPIRKLTKQMLAFQSSNFDLAAIQLTELAENNDNEVAKLSCVFRDMAQRINAQLTVLNQVDNQRRELLTEISHDLRTPLASIKGYIETIALQGEQLVPDTRQAYIATALKSASQLNDLIDQIFELAHLQGGQTSINLESFNLSELLYDVIAKYSIKAEQAQITLTLTDIANDLYVHSDIGKLERILSNLIDNAIRHTPPKGEISLSVSQDTEQHVIVKVTDTGTGIKNEELAYIFDARYRASNATSGKHSGLGLAISKKLTELLKSDLKVQSELGKGSQFSFNLRKAFS
ncbi:MAG: HAMP domain-containing sensor histidine kinase [Thalassotalea sp.]